MQYSRLVHTYQQLEATQSTDEKSSILAELFREADPDDLEVLGHLAMGRAFPAWETLEMGIGSKLMVRAIATATGNSEEAVEDEWRETGDLGDTVEQFVEGKKQRTLDEKELDLAGVQENLEKIASMSGEGSEEKKISHISELIAFAGPEEAKYLVRMVLENLRVGVGEGLVRDAIVKAFFADVVDASGFTERLEERGMTVGIDDTLADDVKEYGLYDSFAEDNEVVYVDPEELELEDFWTEDGYDLVVLEDTGDWEDELTELVQHAYDVSTDLGAVARTAAEDGVDGLDEMAMEVFRPLKVMLAQKAETMEDAYDTVGDEDGVAALEYKYDGFRVQIHKKGDEVKVFSRRLEDVTDQFPDIVAAVKEHIEAEECIIEGETVAYDPEDGSMVPFQQLSKRIKRKYDIQRMVQEIPVTVYLFDIIRVDGESMLEEPLRERWDALEGIVDGEEQEMVLAHHLETADMEEAQTFYQTALDRGQEGIMLKNMDARYRPGSRVGYMVKLKPVMETLDLVIVEADWGEGRRSDWLGSYLLACRNEETGELETVGKMATGFTDEQLQAMTDRLEDLVVEEEGRHVVLKPEVVVEAAYEEIQQSPEYESGYALRFPRLVQVREDMDPEEANELEKVEDLYESQHG
ncbi:MAG: ATP-dependent DNA ligase [Candidatus Nanohaloarchaea archaeon]|nr:ATP-dependent DNA ligase [Candidatus Nanohaloarchaea archaeon]